MRIPSLLFSLLLLATGARAQQWLPYTPNGWQWGLATAEGQVHIPAQYHGVEADTRYGFYYLRADSLVGLLAPQGHWLAKPRYQSARAVAHNLLVVRRHGIDSLLFLAQAQAHTWQRSRYVAEVHTPHFDVYLAANGSSYLVDSTGLAQARDLTRLHRSWRFANGHYWLFYTRSGMALLDSLGRNCLPENRYVGLQVLHPETGLAFEWQKDTIAEQYFPVHIQWLLTQTRPAENSVLRSGIRLGVVSLQGHELLRPNYTNIQYVRPYFVARNSTTTEVMHTDGHFLNLTPAENYTYLGGPYFAYQVRGSGIGLADTTGRRITQPTYSDLWLHPNQELLYVRANTGCGLINANGQELLPPTYDCYTSRFTIDPNKVSVFTQRDTLGYSRSTGVLSADNLRDSSLTVAFVGPKYSFLERMDFQSFTRAGGRVDTLSHHWGYFRASQNDPVQLRMFTDLSGKPLLANLYHAVGPVPNYPQLNAGYFYDERWKSRAGIDLIEVNKAKRVLNTRALHFFWPDLNRRSFIRVQDQDQRFALLRLPDSVRIEGCSYIDPPLAAYQRLAVGGDMRWVNHRQQAVDEPGLPIDFEFRPNQTNRHLAVYDAQWGLIDVEGHWMVRPQFDFLGYPRQGLMRAKLKGRWGMVDLRGQTHIDFSYTDLQYLPHPQQPWRYFSEELLLASDGKLGIINTQGQVRIPLLYDEIRPIVLGTEKGFLLRDGKSWGLANLHGRLLLPVQYHSLRPLPAPHEHLLLSLSHKPNHGYFDQQMRSWQPPMPFRHYAYADSVWVVRDTVNRLHFLDHHGRALFAANFYQWAGNGQGCISVRGVDDWMLLSYQGDTLLRGFNDLGPRAQNRIAAKEKPKFQTKGKKKKKSKNRNRWGYIDPGGNWVVPPRFKQALPFDGHGLARVKVGRRWGLIDTTGRWILPTQYSYIGEFDKQGHARVRKSNKKFGYLHASGRWAIPPQYEHLGPLIQQRAWFKDKNRLFGYLDAQGQVVVQPQYAEARDYSEGYAVVRYHSRVHRSANFALIDTLGQALSATGWVQVSDVRDSTFFAKNQGRSQCLGIDLKPRSPFLPGTELRATDFEQNIGLKPAGRSAHLVIDTQGRVLYPEAVDRFDRIGSNLVGLRNKANQRYALLHAQSRVMLEYRFDEIRPLADGFFYYRQSHAFELWNAQGQRLVPDTYFHLQGYGKHLRLYQLQEQQLLGPDGQLRSLPKP